MLRFFEVYAKHAALNVGQALQGVRYFFSHPDADEIAPRGTLRHTTSSARLRSKRIANDLFFAVLPPQSHHSREELAAMRPIAIAKWFQYGYCAWRFTDTGEVKPDVSGVDRRWDPRCRQQGSVGDDDADADADRGAIRQMEVEPKVPTSMVPEEGVDRRVYE